MWGDKYISTLPSETRQTAESSKRYDTSSYLVEYYSLNAPQSTEIALGNMMADSHGKTRPLEPGYPLGSLNWLATYIWATLTGQHPGKGFAAAARHVHEQALARLWTYPLTSPNSGL